MNINNLVSIAILIFILLVALILVECSNKSILMEGLETKQMPTDYPWDYDYLNAQNQTLGFNLNQSDPNNVNANKFIQILINLDIPYKTIDVTNPNPTFPPFGKGVCASDWNDITDKTTGVRGERTVRMQNGKVLLTGPMHRTNPQKSYDYCLNYANQQKQTYPSINTFAIQYGGYCLVGDTNDLAINENVKMTNDYRGYNEVVKFNNTNNCKWKNIETGGGWTQIVYSMPPPEKRYRFDEPQYSEKINEFLKNALTTYESIINSAYMNKVNFTTIQEGMATTNPRPTVAMYPPGQKPNGILITSIGNGVKDVDDNIIKVLKQTGFKVTVEEYNQWISNLVKYDTSDDEYISVASNFGLDSEDKIYGFYAVIKNILDIKISQNPPPFVIKYAVEFFQKWININNMDELNKFASLIDKYKLKTVPDMPIAKVVFALNSINVKWFDYDDFFGVWQQNSTQTNDVMSIIVNNLTDETVFNYKYSKDSKKLNEMIHFAMYSDIDITKPLDVPTPVDGFKKLHSTLQNLNGNYETYINYYVKLQNIVGAQPNIKTILPNFTTYYNTVAYKDVAKYTLANPVTLSTLFDEFIYKIDPIDSADKYFTPDCGADFNVFLKNLTSSNITVNNIITQKNYNGGNPSSGQSYCDFMSGRNQSTKSGFKNMDEIEDILTQMMNSIRAFFYNLFSSKEGAEDMKKSINHHSIFQRFFGVGDYSSKLIQFENDLKLRGILNYDDTAVFAESCVKLNLYYTDYPVICKIFDDFNGSGTPMTADNLLKVISKLGKIGISGIEEIKKLIDTISRFGVKFSTNFTNFLDQIATFNMGNKSVNVMSIIQFVNDMINIRITYDNKSGRAAFQNIIHYFVSVQIPLRMYYSGSPGISIKISTECATKTIPANFPSLFVNALNMYKAKSSKYDNALHDILTPAIFNADAPLCDKIIAMQQAYMLCKNVDTYGDMQSIIIPNMILIVSFLYKEELDELASENSDYSDITKRISMMQDVGVAMTKYANEFKENPSQKSTFDLYNSLSNVFKLFPALMFQYISEDIASKCGNGNCIYNQYVDCNYTYCKACSTTRTTNYRTTPPVL